MSSYTARVELHHATYQDYVALHAAMEARGFARTIKGDNGIIYNLPTGTYDVAVTSVNLDTARKVATEAANSTGKQNEVLVVERNAASWQGLKLT